MKKRKTHARTGPVWFSLLITVILLCSFLAVNELRKDILSYGLSEVSLSDGITENGSEWYLLLVNKDNAVPEGYSPELTELDNGRLVDSRMYPYLQEMFDDMRAEKIYPVVGEGFRTDEEQRKMMEDKIKAHINDGLPPKRARKAAENEVAPVGKSEHRLGLAVDINADKSKTDNEEVYRWLRKNAYKYGFILRYPADKTNITGIDYEPWHYRYVGKEAAEYITSEGICLEEYISIINKNTKGEM